MVVAAFYKYRQSIFTGVPAWAVATVVSESDGLCQRNVQTDCP